MLHLTAGKPQIIPVKQQQQDRQTTITNKALKNQEHDFKNNEH